MEDFYTKIADELESKTESSGNYQGFQCMIEKGLLYLFDAMFPGFSKYPEVAFEGMVDMVLENRPVVAEDSAMSGDIGGADDYIKALKKIRK